MARKAYARRYAQAVFEIALETKELERWQSDLSQVVSVLGDAAFRAALESPKLHFEDKSRLISTQLSQVSPLALNLVRLLVSRGRLDIINNIADEYQRLLDSYQGIERAEVITAVPITAEYEQKLAKHLGGVVGKKVVLKTEIDPGVVGGFIARVGGKLLDGSSRSRLDALKRELAGAGG